MARLLVLGDFLGDCNKNIHGKEAHTILVVARQVLEQGYHFVDDYWRVHFLDKLCEVIRGLSPHHRRFVMHQIPEILSKALLQRLRSSLVGDTV